MKDIVRMDTEMIFFSLLQFALFGKSLPEGIEKAHIDWKSVWSLAVMHSVEGLVGEAALQLSPECQPSDKIKEKMHKALMINVGAHAMTEKALIRCIDTFRRNGIEPILLKGQGLASLYPKPKLRSCGDIDLYVGEENFDKARNIADAMLADANQEINDTAKHYSLRCEGVTVELHRRAADILKASRRKPLLLWEKGCLADLKACERLRVKGCDVLVPSVTFNAVYVFLHLWFHFSTEEGIGLRQLCDWAMLLHNHAGRIDRKEVERVLRELDVVKGWQMIGSIVVERLGLPAAEMPLYAEKAPRMTNKALRRILSRGNFGLYAPDYPGEYQRNMSFVKRKIIRTRNFIIKYYDAAQFAPIDFTRHFAPTIWGAIVNSSLQVLGLRKRAYERPSH